MKVDIDAEYKVHYVETDREWLAITIYGEDGELEIEIDEPHNSLFLTIEDLEILLAACKEAADYARMGGGDV